MLGFVWGGRGVRVYGQDLQVWGFRRWGFGVLGS